MWKVTLLFSRSTLSSKLLKTSYDSLVLKMHAQGKVQGERWSRGVEGRPGRLPSGSTGRGQAEDEKAQTKARTTGPRQIQFFQGPQSPTCRQLVSSEMTTQESVASWGGILTISVTRRRQQRRGSPTSGGWLGSGSAGGRDLGGPTTVPNMPCGVRHGAYHHARSRGGITGRGAKVLTNDGCRSSASS